MRAYLFEVPQTGYFKFSYVKTTPDIFFLSALELNPFSNSDTVEYDIALPEKFLLLSQIVPPGFYDSGPN
jgi:hypothetical protein